MSRRARRSRLARRLGVLLVLAVCVVVGTGGAAQAHPLGNFTVNHYDGLQVHPDRIDDLSVVDAAEIPTLQALAAVDTNHDQVASAAERAAYAARRCTSLIGGLQLSAGGTPVQLRLLSSSFDYRPGAAGLRTSRLECRLTGPVTLRRPTQLSFSDSFDGSGVGWHEVTAVADGVALHDSPVPAKSISDQLLHYPNDLLASPLNVRGAELDVRPDGVSTYGAGFKVSGTNAFARAVNRLNIFDNGLVGRDHLTLGVGLLAVAVAMLLGAGHAILPGHGKTIMAAYLVGRRGRLRDVVAVGATVTATHTAGVLVLGLLVSVSSSFAPTSAERWLGVTSGLLVAAVGIGLLTSALRRRRRGAGPATMALRSVTSTAPARGTAQLATSVAASAPSLVAAVGVAQAPVVGHQESDHHEHGHAQHEDADGHKHDHGLDQGHDHGHQHPHPHRHGLFGHTHPHSDEEKPISRGGLVGLGVAGGLVPSPSALVVLLGAINLGRTVFGVALVLAYGLGLAITLTAAGLLLVPLRARADRLVARRQVTRFAKVVDALPMLTAALVLIVGLGLAGRSLTLF